MLFDERAKAGLGKVSDTFCERGTQYGDTWMDCQWLVLRSVLREFGIENLDQERLRIVALAALVDVKHQRFQGGWKADNLVDGMAYGAVLAESMEVLKRSLGGNSNMSGQPEDGSENLPASQLNQK